MQAIELRSSSVPDSDAGAAAPSEDWIDIEIGDDEGRRWLAGRSGLDDEIVKRLLEPAAATYWRRFGRGLHYHARVPMFEGDGSTIRTVDFGFWLEPGRIITVRRGTVPALESAAAACSTGAGPADSWRLTVFVLSEGLGRLEEILRDLTATIDRLEDEVLAAVADTPIHRLGELQSRLVYARRFRFPLANMLSFISSQSGSAIDDALRDELEGFGNVIAQQQELLDLSIDRASALQGQIRDQLSDSMNTATYRFTWVATVFLPLSFLTGLLGINVAGIPGDHYPMAFWLVCGTLCLIAGAWGIAVGRVTSPFRRRTWKSKSPSYRS
jgi:zinc transporter